MKRVVNLVAVADKQVSGYRSTRKEYSSGTESIKANGGQDGRQTGKIVEKHRGH